MTTHVYSPHIQYPSSLTTLFNIIGFTRWTCKPFIQNKQFKLCFYGPGTRSSWKCIPACQSLWAHLTLKQPTVKLCLWARHLRVPSYKYWLLVFAGSLPRHGSQCQVDPFGCLTGTGSYNHHVGNNGHTVTSR